MENQMTARDVFTAVEQMAGLKMELPELELIRSLSDRIKTAIRRNDEEAVAQYATQAVGNALAAAGFTGVLTPRSLREHVAANGWALIHDVVDGRENAAFVLKSKLDAIQGGSQFGSQSTQQNRPSGQGTPDRRGSGSIDTSRNDSRPAPAQQAAAPNRAPANTQSNRVQQAPSQTQHTGASQQQRAVQRTTMQPPAPQRTDGSSQVRSINSAQALRSQSSGAASAGDSVDRKRNQCKVHGGKAALTIEADVTQRGDPTIRIESAKMLNRQERTYDWDSKIAFQLTPGELQHVTALFHGFIDHLKFSSHGPQKDKWLEIQRQTGQYAGTFKVAVGKGSEMHLVQITSIDIGNVASLFRRQCAMQMGESLASLKDALEVVAVAYNDAQAAQAARGGSQQQGYSRQTG